MSKIREGAVQREIADDESVKVQVEVDGVVRDATCLALLPIYTKHDISTLTRPIVIAAGVSLRESNGRILGVVARAVGKFP